MRGPINAKSANQFWINKAIGMYLNLNSKLMDNVLISLNISILCYASMLSNYLTAL